MEIDLDTLIKTIDPSIITHRQYKDPLGVVVTASKDRVLISVMLNDFSIPGLDFSVVDGELVLENEYVG